MAKNKVKKILSIPGLKATISTDGSTFSLSGTVPGDAYDTIKEAISEKQTEEQEVTENE